MNKDEFLKEIKQNIENMSLDESRKIIVEICKDITEENYYKTLYKIKNVNDSLNISFEEIKDDIDKIYNELMKIQNGEIVSKCYEIKTGYYSMFDDDSDYYFYLTKEMNDVLNKLYNLILKLIFSKNYEYVLKIIDLMLYSNYICEEISNPEYCDYDEVIDTFDIDIFSLKNQLDFDLDNVILYGVYACIMNDEKDKFEKIDKYLNNREIDIRKCQNLGIEKIPNIEKIYSDWLNYKKI